MNILLLYLSNNINHNIIIFQICKKSIKTYYNIVKDL